ncbi:MAG: 3-phosphoshikimate 1-carboxyvinyltransferase [Myxococcota bacterium]|nr:3-phosphoshikimate 1-carboxyvinyltransferase [Myxococcota bacterium]
MAILPESLPIEPRGPLQARVRVPGSKSITNRALLIAALAEGESTLAGPLTSDDTDVMRRSLTALGARLDNRGDPWAVVGTGGRLRVPSGPLLVQNSGTTARFLTAAACLAPGPVVIDGNTRMRERPIVHLADALVSLGARLEIEGQDGCPPVRIAGGGLPGGPGIIDGRQSSQYTSAILLAAPYAERDVELGFEDGELVSRPYVETTLAIMRDFGAEVDWVPDDANPGGADRIRVRAGIPYRARAYAIEPDASSAAYPFCAAAIAGGSVSVEGIASNTLQADFRLLDLLERMGCQVMRQPDRVEVRGPGGPLRSLGEVDMNAFPDAVLAFAVVALFADGPTLIKNVWNLRIKETDRLAALETELRKLGARADADRDSLHIQPGPLHGAEIDTYDDHRMAMAFSLAGLRVPGVVIRDPGCVSKTWPQYFDIFGEL